MREKARVWSGVHAPLVVAFACGLIVLVLILIQTARVLSAPERVLVSTWGISVPSELRVQERFEEGSFHGDGYRFTSLDVEAPSQLRGTFFDPQHMTNQSLSNDQIDLIAEVARAAAPSTLPDLQQPGLLLREITRDSNWLLCIYDPSATRYYIFESLT